MGADIDHRVDVFAIGVMAVERRRLESILRRATSSNPATRYASIAALARDLIPAFRALPATGPDPDADTAPGS